MSDSRTNETPSSIPVRTAGLAAAIGAWILWSGIILTGTGAIIWNNVLAGAAIATLASYAAAWPGGRRLPAFAVPAIVCLLGLWVVAAPFVLGAVDRLLWSNVVSGLLVAVLAVGSVYGSLQLSRAGTTGA